MTGFLMWTIFGGLMVLLGILAFRAKKEVGFWANVKPLPMKDVKAYNRAVGWLFIIYGVVFILLGLPLLAGQNSPWVIVPIVGVLLETIAAMAVYTIVIQDKYEKK